MASKVSFGHRVELSEAELKEARNQLVVERAERINKRASELFERALVVHASCRVVDALFEVIESSEALAKDAKSDRRGKMKRIEASISKASQCAQGDVKRFDAVVSSVLQVCVLERGVEKVLSRKDLKRARLQLVTFGKEVSNLSKHLP